MGACCIDYGDGPTLYDEKYRKARKEHKCCECGQTINAGDDYQVITGLWDGRWDEFKTCEKCADLRDSLMDVSCPALGDLRADYAEYLENIGAVKYDEQNDEYIYPQNHLNIGG